MRHSLKPVTTPAVIGPAAAAVAGAGRIVIVRALPGLGDLLCAVPAFRALRHACPHAQVTLLGLPETQPLVQRFGGYIDHLLPFPGFPGLTDQQDFSQLLPFLAEQRQRYDLALQLHGSGRHSNTFTALLAAPAMAGYRPPGQENTEGHFLRWPEREPEPLIWLRLLASLGIQPAGTALEFPLTRADHAGLHALPEAAGLQPGSYACVHPGASEAARRLPPAHFAAAADQLAAGGLQVVLTGTAAERGLAAAVQQLCGSTPLNLAGRTSLGTLAALLQGARLLVCNDTGVSHLAAALQVRSVVAFTASDPARWAPLDSQLHRVVGSGRAPADGPGAAADPVIPSVARVLAAVQAQLQHTAAPLPHPHAARPQAVAP